MSLFGSLFAVFGLQWTRGKSSCTNLVIGFSVRIEKQKTVVIWFSLQNTKLKSKYKSFFLFMSKRGYMKFLNKICLAPHLPMTTSGLRKWKKWFFLLLSLSDFLFFFWYSKYKMKIEAFLKISYGPFWSWKGKTTRILI